jgi:DNA-binding IclR family transcriptional regulator
MATPKNYSVIKAFAILKAFRDEEGGLSGCELSRRANLPQASGYRLIHTMEEIGVITRGKRGQYRPGLLLLSISKGVPWLDLLRDAGQPILTNLALSLDLTAHLAILEKGAVTCIGRYCSVTSFPLNPRVGAQLQACSSALGKVLLASLDRDEAETFNTGSVPVPLATISISSPLRFSDELAAVRRRGFASDNLEPHVRTRCTAVPVKDSHGRTIAAISASEEARRTTLPREAIIKKALFEAAAAIESALYRHRSAREAALQAQ